MAASSAFEQRKRTFLSKDDKSSAGGIDKHCVEVCKVINARPAFFTTSSCSGRAFLWRGDGVKSTDNFTRYKVTHELVEDAGTYFDLRSLQALEPSHQKIAQRVNPIELDTINSFFMDDVMDVDAKGAALHKTSREKSLATSCWSCLSGCHPRALWQLLMRPKRNEPVTWLRFEPFILHVACRDLTAAAALIAAARSVFKNVGLQSWTELKYMVAIWGDEGLDMPLTAPDGSPVFQGNEEWLKSLVNERHLRNWAKITRFTAALRAMSEPQPEENPEGANGGAAENNWVISADDLIAASRTGKRGHRNFDIVGDVAILQGFSPLQEDAGAEVGAILKEYPKLSIVATRGNALSTEHRRPGPLHILAGPKRSPLMTTHTEYGVRYMIDLEETFFSTRLAQERQRLCSMVMPGENVCVLFAGCGPEVLQIAAHAAASSIVGVELNPVAVKCMKRSLDMLSKNMPQAAGKVEVIEGDVLKVCPTLAQHSFHRIVAPRPKLAGDGDLSATDIPGKADEFLAAFLPLLRNGGVCHWYDFAADWELPECRRTLSQLHEACKRLHLHCEVLRRDVANRKAIAERQYRIVVDFSVRRFERLLNQQDLEI
mmetsp:Transcript_49091/g.114826  ORF Transcript_49091/g.114826 Transcript_49091/m.114826 type:complete len:601 (-) Transcript_49091:8-1810(-)